MTMGRLEFDGDSHASVRYFIGMTRSDDAPNSNLPNCHRTTPSGAGQKRLRISCARLGRPPCGQIPVFLSAVLADSLKTGLNPIHHFERIFPCILLAYKAAADAEKMFCLWKFQGRVSNPRLQFGDYFCILWMFKQALKGWVSCRNPNSKRSIGI